VILMTSNVGARDMERKPVGFGGEAGAPAGSDEKEYKLLFSPEFRNRLDARIAFAHLTPEIMGNIAGKFIAELAAQLKPKKVTIELTLAARKFLADEGYDRQFGARPMARVVQDLVNKPLAEELLFGRLANGGHVKIDLNAPGEGLVFDFGDVTAMA
jgi:ATP-dependent Clp protease ATP-binding subunit ClpA